MQIKPNIIKNIQIFAHNNGYEVVNPKHRTTLHINALQYQCLKRMNGENDLEKLEQYFIPTTQTMSYPLLIQLIHALWDRGMLEEASTIQSELFPQDKQATLSLSKQRKRLYTLFAGFWPVTNITIKDTPFVSKTLKGAPVCLTLAACGLLCWMVVPQFETPTSEWLYELPLVYILTCALLSLSQFIQAKILATNGSQFRMGPRNFVGIFFWDFAESRLFSAPFTLAPISVVFSIISVCSLTVLFSNNATLWAATQAFVLVSLCPFLPTASAYTIEHLLNVPKQRYRIRQFFTQHIGLHLFRTTKFEHEWRYGLAACLWILWFYMAIHIVGGTLKGHYVELMFLAHDGSIFAGLCLVLFVISMLVICMVLLIPIRILFLAFKRLLPPEGPKSKSPMNALDEEKKEGTLQCYNNSLIAKLHPNPHYFLKGATLHTYDSNQWIYPHIEDGISIVVSGQLQRQRYTIDGHYQFVGMAETGTVIGIGEDTDASRCLGPVELLYWPASTRHEIHSLQHDDARSFLQSFSGFSKLSTSQLDIILHHAVWKKYKADEFVLKEGEAANALILLQEGQFVVTRAEKELNRLNGYSIIGEMGLLSGRSRNASVKSLKFGRGLHIPAKIFHQIMEESISIRRELGGLLSTREAAK